MDFPGFDTLAVGFIALVALREIVARLRRARATPSETRTAPAKA